VVLRDWLEHRQAGEGLDLRGYDLRENSFTGLTLENVRFRAGPGRGFGAGPGSVGDPALLPGVSFRDATLVGVSFSDTDLDGVDFRGTTLRRCDFRRAEWQGGGGAGGGTVLRPAQIAAATP